MKWGGRSNMPIHKSFCYIFSLESCIYWKKLKFVTTG